MSKTKPKTPPPAPKTIQMGAKQVDTRWLAARLQERPQTPPGKRGRMRVTVETVPAGEPHHVVSLRNALFMGYAPTRCVFDSDLEIRSLSYEGGEWMTDSPQEVWQMHEPLEALREMDEPELLVGGLGLGVFTRLADQYAGAITTTVEKDRRVIDLVAAHAARRVELGDIYKHAKRMKPGEYDAAFLDTWQRTGEYAWTAEVVPLRRLIGDKIPAEHIWCWNEEEMTGQIRLSGLRAMTVPLPGLPPSSVHWRVLRRMAEQAWVAPTDVLPKDPRDRTEYVFAHEHELHGNATAVGILERFVRHAGSGPWEAEFGAAWDQSMKEYRAWQRDQPG